MTGKDDLPAPSCSTATAQKISTAWVDRLDDRDGQNRHRRHVWSAGELIGWRLTDTTIVYDTSTGLWHERQSRALPRSCLTAWNVARSTVLGGRVLGGHISARALLGRSDVCDEDGDEMIMRVRTPPVSAFPGRIGMNRLLSRHGAGRGAGARGRYRTPIPRSRCGSADAEPGGRPARRSSANRASTAGNGLESPRHAFAGDDVRVHVLGCGCGNPGRVVGWDCIAAVSDNLLTSPHRRKLCLKAGTSRVCGSGGFRGSLRF